MATKAQCSSCKLKFERSLTIERSHCPDNFKLYLDCFPSAGSRSNISAKICKQDFFEIFKIKK